MAAFLALPFFCGFPQSNSKAKLARDVSEEIWRYGDMDEGCRHPMASVRTQCFIFHCTTMIL